MSEFIHEFSLNTSYFFSSVLEEQLSAQKYFLVLIRSLNSPEVLISLLQNTDSLQIFFMCCQVLGEMLLKKWSIFSVSQKLTVYTEVLQKLAVNGSQYAEKKFLSCLVKLVCRIARQSWNEDIEFLKLSQYCIEFLQQPASVACIGLQIILNLIEDMSLTTEHQLLQHQRNARMFKNWTLPIFFSESSACLSRISPDDLDRPEIVNVAELVTEIISKILEFCKESEVTALLPGCPYWDPLKSLESVRQFSKLYKLFVNNAKVPTNILAILGAIATTSESFFDGPNNRNEIVGEIVLITQEILTSQIGLTNEHNLHEFIVLLSRISMSNCFQVIACPNFQDLVEKAFLMTKEIIASKANDNFLCNMLAFWEYLAKYAKESEIITVILFEVCKTYIAYFIQNPDACEQQTFKECFASIATLCKVSFFENTQWILAIFESLSNQYFADSDKFSSLCRTIEILCAFISRNKKEFLHIVDESTKKLKNSQDLIETFERYSKVGEIVHHVVLLLNHLVEKDCKVVELLTESLNFLKFFIRIYLPNASTQACLEVIYEKFMLENETGLIVLLLSNIFRISETNASGIYKLCMEIFADLASFTRIAKADEKTPAYFYCGTLKFEESVIFEIIFKWSSRELSFVSPQFNKKSRCTFVRSIFKLFFLVKHRISLGMSQMLSPIDQIMAEVATNTEIVDSLFYDLLGVAQSIANSDHYTEFFEWLCEKSTFLLQIFSLCCSQVTTRKLFFEFLQEISFNRTERLTFLSNKSIGNSLFRFCEKNIRNYLMGIETSLEFPNPYEEFYKPLSKSIKVFTNILTNKHINLTLLLQEQSILETFKLVLNSIMMVPTEEITFCIKIFGVFFEFLNFVTENPILLKDLIYDLEGHQSEKVFDLLIEGCQSLDQCSCQLSYVIIKSLVHSLIFKKSEASEKFLFANAGSFVKLMKILLVLVLGGEPQNLSLISYPLLGLINLFKSEYLLMLGGLCLIQGPERVELVRHNIENLWSGLDFNWQQEGFFRNMKISKEFEKRLTLLANNLKLSS